MITYSYNNDLPLVAGQDQIDGIIPLCQTAGVGVIELMCNHAEPASELAVQQAAARAARMAALAAAAAAGNHTSLRRVLLRCRWARSSCSRRPRCSRMLPAEPWKRSEAEALKARDDLRQWRLSNSHEPFPRASPAEKISTMRASTFSPLPSRQRHRRR